MNDVKKWWNGLTSNQKFFIVVLALITLWIVYRYSKGAIEGIGGAAQSQGALTVLQSQGVKPTYSSDKYATWANVLENAMSGMGTDEDTIALVFKYQHNDADMVKLNQAFGIRQNETMNQWLKADLGPTDISNINSLLREKGITRLIK